MSIEGAVMDAPKVELRDSGRGAMAGGGSVSHEVYVDGRWVGWVGDGRQFTGARFAGRRWWAVWREDGDSAARWNSFAGDGFGTRKAAVEALVAKVASA